MGFFGGAGAFFEGMAFVVATPRVWARALVPMLAALVLFAGLGALGVWAAMRLADGVLGVLLALPAILLALVLALALAQPVSGWALDGIVRAKRQEMGLPRLPEGSALDAMLGSLAAALLAFAIGLPVIAALTVAGWLFPPAVVVTLPLKLFVGALMIAWDLVDYPLAMHGVRLGDRFRWVADHFGAFLGFGLAATMFFAVPVLGLLALPCGVAGAARLVAGTDAGRV
ncbi:MAG TPA: EI24 domain-containing protein [Polyangiaceae bacterium]|jgi:CysZ protein